MPEWVLTSIQLPAGDDIPCIVACLEPDQRPYTIVGWFYNGSSDDGEPGWVNDAGEPIEPYAWRPFPEPPPTPVERAEILSRDSQAQTQEAE